MPWILSRPSGIPDPIPVGVTAPIYSSSITPDASQGSTFTVTPTNGTAFTINAPVNLHIGQRILFTLRNTTGGPLGAVTWNALYHLATWTNPANGNSRSIEFVYDGVRLTEINRTSTDVPN